MRCASVLLAALLSWAVPASAQAPNESSKSPSQKQTPLSAAAIIGEPTPSAQPAPVLDESGKGDKLAPVGSLQLTPGSDVDGFKPDDPTLSAPQGSGVTLCPTCPSQAEFEARERRCLATAIYFISRDRPLRGQIGVGQVILNKVRHPRFPQTICGVVYQDQSSPCPLHFPCHSRTGKPQDDAAWKLAQSVAKKIMAGELWLPQLVYAVAVETALQIGTSNGNHWSDCVFNGQADVEMALAACTDFIEEMEMSSPDLGLSLDLGRAYKNRGDAYDKKGLHDLAAADHEKAASLGYSGDYEVEPPSPNPEPPKTETVVAPPEAPKTETIADTGTRLYHQ
jgi:hypothetical protein